jgi:hypothetical protein
MLPDALGPVAYTAVRRDGTALTTESSNCRFVDVVEGEMSQSEPIVAVSRNAARRATPVIAAVLVAVAVTYRDSFGGFNPEGLVIVVSLPILAWTLLAPASGLAMWGGLFFLPGVAAWALLLTEASVVTSRSDADIKRAYPLAASATVAVALIASYTRRWLQRRRCPPPAGGRAAWTVVRSLVGMAALVTGVAVSFTFREPQPVVAVVVASGPLLRRADVSCAAPSSSIDRLTPGAEQRS